MLENIKTPICNEYNRAKELVNKQKYGLTIYDIPDKYKYIGVCLDLHMLKNGEIDFWKSCIYVYNVNHMVENMVKTLDIQLWYLSREHDMLNKFMDVESVDMLYRWIMSIISSNITNKEETTS